MLFSVLPSYSAVTPPVNFKDLGFFRETGLSDKSVYFPVNATVFRSEKYFLIFPKIVDKLSVEEMFCLVVASSNKIRCLSIMVTGSKIKYAHASAVSE